MRMAGDDMAGGRAEPFRLPGGGLIDRARLLNFTFDGNPYVGHPGDTLASALLACGVRLVGRSFKYHRPRGILSAGPEEPNALITLRGNGHLDPNTRATVIELYEGLEALSQNRWPSLRFDLLAVNQFAGSLLAAGFYYKTFKWPASFWEKVYEPLIRRAAGLGRASLSADPNRYEKVTSHCDLLVVGSGPAGLSAALAAARTGARVLLCEQDSVLGGRLLAERRNLGGESASRWVARMEAELRAHPEARILPRTTVFGVYDHGTCGAVENVNDHVAGAPEFQPHKKLWRIIAKSVVLATGATERPLLFGENDRPGVMLAGAVRAYVNRFAVAPGRRAIVFANNDDALRTAIDLSGAGVEVPAVIDARAHSPMHKRVLSACTGTRLFSGAVLVRSLGGSGVRAAEISTREGPTRVECDLIAVSGGWSPNLQLACHLGGKPVWNEQIAGFVPHNMPHGMSVVGAAAGVFTTREALQGGTQAGLAAARLCGFGGASPELPVCEDESAAMEPLWRVKGARGKVFVDLQHDVVSTDIELAQREGFDSAELVKRYTTLGMATDQGKTSSLNGLAIIAGNRGKSVAEVGATTFRPPYTPVSIGALAGRTRGRHLRPTRLPPTHDWASGLGAVFMDAGLWLRAQYFPRDGEDLLASCNREVTAVRQRVGVCDVSTLGKIDVQGADAAVFLDRVYANAIASLPVARARYALMLREDGFVFDDGTVARLGESHFVLSTTTANAGAVMAHLEFCSQWLWPALDVNVLSVTEHWAQMALAGPRARDVLRKIVDPAIDVSNAAVPYMAAIPIKLPGGIAGRLFRLSFSGELGYEIAVPARWGDALVRSLMQAGEEFGVTPYGLEAMAVMRIEKGHVAAGELNGRTTARDLGLGKMLSTRKADFIGRVMSQRTALIDPDRPALAGFRALGGAAPLTAGARLIPNGTAAIAANDQGFITSAAYSPHSGSWLGLGLVRGGVARAGERIRAIDALRGFDVPVEITPPCSFDPEGVRLRV